MSGPEEALDRAVADALEAAPEPEAAQRRAKELLSAARSADPEALSIAEPVTVGRVLLALCGVAPFLTRHLQRRPETLLALFTDDFAAPRTLEQHQEALRDLPEDAPETALRRHKYAELARLCTRDTCDAWIPLERSGETLREISILADALLARAFEIARARVAERFGPARWGEGDTAFEPGLAVLGLGKLGGGELNFSSDVDLIYVFESPPPGQGSLEPGPSELSIEGWASRVVTEFGRIVSESSVDGFLYRIDLELRPEGAGGPRVIGSDPLAAYYDGSAALWEKAAFTKARPVAGDLAFGWRIVRAVHPMIYRSAMDYAMVGAIREMKRRVEEAHSSGDGFDVKLGTGGIRDIEFVTQALQLLHGGRIPDVRGRSTQEALEALAAHRLLPSDEAQTLLAAYRFLRRLENRLQMEDERQTHLLADGEETHRRAARAMGLRGGRDGFDAALAQHRTAVREAFERLFAEGDEERVLGLFRDVAARLLQLPGGREMVELLAAHFAREVGEAPDPDLALNNLARFIEGVGPRSVYYGLLLDRPELVGRLAKLFGASRYLSNFFAAHPDLIEPVFADPDVLVLSPAELRKDRAELFEEFAGSDRDPVDAALAALRLFHHRQLVNVGLLDLDGRICRAEAEHALTDLAEACLDAALELARQQTARFSAATSAGELLVVGMGKLASREMSYGSDLDLVFLYRVEEGESEGADLLEAQSGFARQAQKLIGALDTPTAEGSCYSVDARLRPSGGQGALVTSLDAFRAHHEKSAMAWERQALLRARPVAGSESLGERFEAVRRELLARPAPDDLNEEMHRVRMRMEEEIGKESGGRRDLKVGRGGLVDVEFAVQYLQLRHGADHPELFEVGPLEGRIHALQTLGLLDERAAATLSEGWDFLQRLASRLRIVQNRSITDLHADRADLDAVARALGHEPSSRTGDARRPLLEDYKRTTEAIRSVYLDVLGVAPSR